VGDFGALVVFLKNEATDLYENKGSGFEKKRNEATVEGGRRSDADVPSQRDSAPDERG